MTALNRTGSPPEGGMTIIVIGAGLDPAATVAINGVAALDVHYDPNASATAASNLVLVTPPNPEGFYDLVVTNPDGQSATYPRFHYGPPPVISSVSPTSVRKGDLVTIAGANFAVASGVSVNVGGTPVQILSKTETALVIAAPKLNVGTYQVFVFNFDSQYTVAADRLVYPAH
ncbi:MAG TPA: IPT/TIG domain-containing protein [Myxococcales bacterium]|nr:IPT/TIG domain-containing protein [Myxococcales bacterium]